MAKEVTVLALEGDFLRGVQLAEAGGAFARHKAETWAVGGPAARPAEGEEEGAAPAPEAEASGVEEAPSSADLLTQAFQDAATVFATREFILSVPLSRLLVKVVRVPADARDELEERAQDEIAAISPFPDEPLAVGVEAVAETDAEIVAVAAALPVAAAEDISEALAAAKVNVVRTDVSALGRLRAFWPQICSKEGVARRLVLMNLDGGWDVIVLDDGAPVFLRGLGGGTRTPEELARDVTLSLLQGEGAGGTRAIGDVAVIAAGPVEEAVLQRLAAFGPVRTVETAGDEFESAEGVAQRAAEGATCDVTPEAWAMSLREARFRKKMIVGASAALGLWLAIMGVFFGVPFAYGQMTARQVAQSKRHQAAYRDAKSIQTKLKMVQGYSDRAHGALMLMKRMSDNLPDGARLRDFKYTRDDVVSVQGDVDADSIVYDYKNALFALRNDDEDETKLFPGGVELSGLRAGKFRLDATLKAPDEDEMPARTAARRRTR